MLDLNRFSLRRSSVLIDQGLVTKVVLKYVGFGPSLRKKIRKLMVGNLNCGTSLQVLVRRRFERCRDLRRFPEVLENGMFEKLLFMIGGNLIAVFLAGP